MIIYRRSDTDKTKTPYQVKKDPIDIQMCNLSVAQILGFQALPNNKSFDIPINTLKVPLFRLGNPEASFDDGTESLSSGGSEGSDSNDREKKISSLLDLLLNPELLGTSQEIVLKIKQISTDEKRVVHLTHSQMRFNDMECLILTIRDISAQQNLERAEQKNNLLHLLTSSVSHELMTPIKCIITFATELLSSIKNSS